MIKKIVLVFQLSFHLFLKNQRNLDINQFQNRSTGS